MDIRTALRKCAVRVEKGWCQGLMREGRNVCAYGAIDIVARNNDRLYTGLVTRVRRVIGSGKTISGWNDYPGRTKVEVAAMFRRAARTTTR